MTYNPGVELEQTLAIRLHTIGQINGFEMYLPDRYNNPANTVDQETAFRISAAKWFICFSTQRLSAKVKKEIDYAFQTQHDQSKIIVVYDASRFGKNIRTAKQFREYYFDPRKDTPDHVMVKILSDIDQANQLESELGKLRGRLEKSENEKKAMAAFLGIGIGLLALNALASADPPKEAVKKTSTRKSATTKKIAAKKTTPKTRKPK